MPAEVIEIERIVPPGSSPTVTDAVNDPGLTRRRVVEITTTGIDEFLQGIGGDPYGGSSWVGLRVPTLASTDRNRYLFLLATFSLPAGSTAKILGYRQLVTLGKSVGSPSAPRFVEMEITSPQFRLPDGNVSFHLQRLGPPNAQGFPRKVGNKTDLRSFHRGYCESPALLYESYTIAAGDSFYVDLTSYTPPNSGKPWGVPLRAGTQGTFYDLRTPWRSARAWTSLSMELDGPETVALFASVRQSAGTATGVAVNSGTVIPGNMPEEQFISAYASGVVYWRVAGSLIVETSP